ncbi:vacuolar fusion protein MON1 homolog isoform X2 [Sorghum bicolor]|uniref:vacuolar fusion protein MON1 homolog isoform X2 n=1 Tax=Sorghum bicolor TaxID=4558 RepID=UPI000B4256B6|nr:vacuolar fusion protein MON1 homolog isoform X2 [Sorghum bicolor]|eukprot:XP_021312907.1 vacuolar fusion protein MON1 homolog isoform X2 [Sorghum bicolor]
MDPHNPNPTPTDAPSPPAESAARLAALSLRGTRDLPPDFHTAEIHDLDDDDDDDDEGYLTAASRGGSSTSAWKEAPEGLHDDDKDGDDVSQPSPSSSGYAGERGSSLDDDPDPEPAQDWPRDKKHLHEDDASSSWRKRKKHFFILSNSGKPIYSRYGDEHKLAGFSATLQAIISFVENSGDHIKFVRAGKHQGPIYLVCISCTEESYEGLRGQLELMYGQLLLILTKSVNRCFEKNPRFDMATLLGGTDAVFQSLIHAFSWNPATFLHAYTCLPLAQSTRQAASAVLQDVADSGVLFVLLMCEHKVISLVGAQKATLHPDDILLLANFILSSESFRTSESFVPICLPRYNPMAYLHAYVHFFDEHTYVALLTTRSDAFYDLKDSRARIQNVLLKSNVLIEVQRSLHENALCVEDLPTDPSSQSASHPPESSRDMNSQSLSSEMAIGGPGGLWHFIYKSVYLDQFVSSEFPSPISNKKQQKRLYKAYQKLYASMHDKATGPHKTQYRRDEDYVLFCWITQDFELYAAFNPLADKTQAIKMCNRVCQWVRDLENEIFVYGESALSWQYHRCWGGI